MFFAYSAGTRRKPLRGPGRRTACGRGPGATPCRAEGTPLRANGNGLRPTQRPDGRKHDNALRAITIMHPNQELVQVPWLMNQ